MKKTNSETTSQKKKRNEDGKSKEINNQLLLNTINIIGSKAGIHFDNFEFLENENLLKFILCIFSNDQKSQEYIKNIINNNDSNIDKINSIIKYISTKEPAFKVLIFDFEEDYLKPSLLLFFQNILNFFFLKKPKKKLYGRCYSLLYGKYIKGDKNYKSYNNEKEILSDWNTYMNLIYFIYCRKTDINLKKISNDQQFHDFQKKFPMIFDENLLMECTNEGLHDSVYYQLQIIFDEIDSNIDKYNIIECLLRGMNLIKNIKIPPFEIIQQNARDKNISLFIQQQRYKKNFLNNKRNVIDDNNENNDKEIEKLPLNFEEKSLTNDISIQNKDENLNNSSNPYIETKFLYFWDGYVLDESFHRGIICNLMHINESLDFWNKIMSYTQKDTKQLKESKLKNYDLESLNRGLRDELTNKKILRLLYYAEKINQWIPDLKGLSFAYVDTAFDAYCYTQDLKPEKPIVLFLDSFEDESIELTSKLNDFDFKLNKNTISIYMVCNKFLSEITSKFDQYQKEIMYMPIFFFLHVPKSKRYTPNIKSILLGAYSFLTLYTNINVVILNKNYCIDQIGFIKEIFEIKQKFAFRENEIKNYQVLEKEKEKLAKKKNKGKKNYPKEEYFFRKTSHKESHMNNLDPNIFKKQAKLIILINDEIITKNKANKNIINNEIFQTLNDPSLNLSIKVSFINIKDESSYDDYIVCLGDFLINSKSEFNEFSSNSSKINLFKMSFMYYNIRREKDWKSKLKDIIYRRYYMINDTNSPQLISKSIDFIGDEIFHSYPLFDIEYGDECNLILSEIKNKANIEHNKEVFQALRKSSVNNLNYIARIVKNSHFWNNDQIDNIRNSHIHFLKQEYFNIIKMQYPKKSIHGFYESNIHMLNSYINEDCKRINLMFEEFQNDMKKKKIKKVEMRKGTNYTIREKENEREIKVRVEIGGKLEDLIEQDF